METVRRLPMQAAETDPVLAALIARLPPSGSLWPAKKRAAWMQMMWMAFDLAYENDGDAVELPAFLQASGSVAVAVKEQAPVQKPKPSPFAFLIDQEGFARSGDGTRINPADVGGVMFDQRGEAGDLGAIIWADGTTGVRGLTIDVSPAF